MTPAIDLRIPRSIHVIGIGGSGMSAIATVLLSMGHRVSGSDAADGLAVSRLREQGATVSVGHAASNLPAALDALVFSTAVPKTNPEMVAASERNIVTLRRAEMLSSISALRKTLAVAGTHGKTTTSTLLAHVLESAATSPSWIIGGEIAGKSGGAQWDSGEYFVVEADESDGTFVELGAYGVIVTNLEADHLEFYGQLDDRDSAFANLVATFDRFVVDAPGPKVLCADDPASKALADRHAGTVTYGTDETATYCISDVELDRFSAHFSVTVASERVNVELWTAGLHNVRNATAALALAHQLGISLEQAASGVTAFQGVGRRFTMRGEYDGITFVDEYAHLPGEVKAALAAAKAGNWKRIVAVFQPHRYSRTEQVGHEFIDAFDDADELVLNGVYAAGEKPRPGIDGHLVERAVAAGSNHPPISYVEERSALSQSVAAMLQPGDLCITLGAGDVTALSDEVLTLLQEKGAS